MPTLTLERSLDAAAQRLRTSLESSHVGNPSYALADLVQAARALLDVLDHLPPVPDPPLGK